MWFCVSLSVILRTLVPVLKLISLVAMFSGVLIKSVDVSEIVSECERYCSNKEFLSFGQISSLQCSGFHEAGWLRNDGSVLCRCIWVKPCHLVPLTTQTWGTCPATELWAIPLTRLLSPIGRAHLYSRNTWGNAFNFYQSWYILIILMLWLVCHTECVWVTLLLMKKKKEKGKVIPMGGVV